MSLLVLASNGMCPPACLMKSMSLTSLGTAPRCFMSPTTACCATAVNKATIGKSSTPRSRVSTTPRLYASPMAGGIWYTELPAMPCFVGESKEVTLTIAPNPASTFLTVAVSEPLHNAELTVYDLQGKVCYSSRMQGDRCLITTNDFLSGIYFVKVVGDNASIVRKITIQH